MSDEIREPHRTVSVVLPVVQRSWLIRQAAERAASTGERASVSEVVRDLVERARREGA